MTLDPVIAWTLRASLAGVFFAAASHKWSQRTWFESTVRSYALLPSPLVRPVAALLPWVEGATALFFLRTETLPLAVLAAETLLSTYTLAIAINLARGRYHIDCGCFTSTAETQLSPRLLARNLALIAASSALLLPVGTRALAWLDCITIVTAFLAISFLWSAAQRLTRTGPALRQLGGSR